MSVRFFVFVLLVATAVVPGAVAAQGNTTETPGPSDGGLEWSGLQNESADGTGVTVSVTAGGSTSNATNSTDPRVVDSSTVILRDEYDQESGVFRIVVRSDKFQAVSLTDAAPVVNGGQIRVRSARLQPGRNVIEFEATRVDGRAVVVLSTPDGAYSIVDRGGSLISGPWSKQDVQVAGVSGAVTVALVVLLVVLRAALGGSHESEWIA